MTANTETNNISLKNILFLGEGNFSFTLSFLKKHVKERKYNVIGTSYENEETCMKKYGAVALENVKNIKEMNGTVLHGVDATNLSETLLSQLAKYCEFDAIVFNFPHIGRKAGIALNRYTLWQSIALYELIIFFRKLLKDFFVSSCQLLNENGYIEVNLAAGQGGTAADSKQREHCNSWQVIKLI